MEAKTLCFITSSNCNLRCSYCYLNKIPYYVEKDKEITQAIKTGEFLTNIKKSLEILNISREDFTVLELWGAEPSYHLDLLSNHLNQILNDFPNLNEFFLSSNFTYDVNQFFIFTDKLLELSKEKNRKIKLKVQISMDGPDWILNDTRGISYSQIKKNLIKYLDKYNNMHLGNLSIYLWPKGTLSFDMLERICSSKESIIKYVKFYDQEYKDIIKHAYNENLYWNNKHFQEIGCAPVRPEGNTVECGIKIAAWARLWDSIDFSAEGIDYGTDNLMQVLYGIFCSGEAIEFKTSCGQGESSFSFKYDGTVIPCTGTFMEDEEEYIKYIYENKPEEIPYLKGIQKWFIYPDKVSKKEARTLVKKKKEFWKYQNYFLITVTMALMYEMSLCGQVSPIYAQNEEILYRHAVALLPYLACYRNNIQTSFDPFLPNTDVIKLLCNGLMYYLYEERGRNNAERDFHKPIRS